MSLVTKMGDQLATAGTVSNARYVSQNKQNLVNSNNIKNVPARERYFEDRRWIIQRSGYSLMLMKTSLTSFKVMGRYICPSEEMTH